MNDQKHVHLQVNNAGGWKTVMDFNAGLGVDDEMLARAAALFEMAYVRGSKGPTLRVLMPGDTAPLMIWELKTGWRQWSERHG